MVVPKEYKQKFEFPVFIFAKKYFGFYFCKKIYEVLFKGCVRYIFASFLYAYKRALVKQGKMFFISLRKLFSFLR